MLLVLICQVAYSQSAREYLEKGDKLLSRKDYQAALDQYLLAYGTDGNDPDINFRVGLAYLSLPLKSKALPYLETAYAVKPSVDEDIDYHLGLAYQYTYQFKKAIQHFEAFKTKNKKLSAIADGKIFECTVSDSLFNHPLNVELANLGPSLNTESHEYAPLISTDGNTLIFTSNRSTDSNSNRGPQDSFEDIYVSQKLNDSWGAPQLISESINIKFNDAAASLSHDGNMLFIYYEQGGGDIYISTQDGNRWSKPSPLNKNINSPFWETSACMSADGQQLYFTSSRPGGLGELDIYVSEKDGKGEWGKPRNLGPTINTPGNEDAPFIHSDGKTLYFSSNGHPTMGSNDIFISEFRDGKWQKPRNLGYPINSIEYDGFIRVSDDKRSGYYSTVREEGFGAADIYSISFIQTPEERDVALYASTEPVILTPPDTTSVVAMATAESEEETQKEFDDLVLQLQKELKIVTVLKGKVIDANTADPLAATITLTDNTTNSIIAQIRSNPSTGDFELTIPHGGNYGVSTERNGYLFNSINFNVPQFAEYQEIDASILMVKAEVGSRAVLKNLFFDTGKAELKPESVSELDNLYSLLIENPDLKVQINGHTDDTGDAASNKSLSLRRATSVVDYLIEKGISNARLVAVGYGEERPLVSNDDELDGREINRRTEIEIIEVSAN